MTIGRITRIAFLVFGSIFLFAFLAGSGSDPARSASSLRGTLAVQAQSTIVRQIQSFQPQEER